jgi:hypothetical protein
VLKHCLIDDYRERLGQIPAGDITELPQGSSLQSQSITVVADLNYYQSIRIWKLELMLSDTRILIFLSEFLAPNSHDLWVSLN